MRDQFLLAGVIKKYSFMFTSIRIQIKKPLKIIYLLIQQIHKNRLGAALL